MDGLNFIDIASYQHGISLDAVFALNPLDGVIVKATEGMAYVNPDCDTWVQWLRKHGKLWGFYHFLNASDPRAEAERFVRDTINYYGEGVPVADYEGQIVSSYGTYYLRRFLDTVHELTGVKPLVYCNLNTIQTDVNGFRQIAGAGYKLWLAQYASNRDAAIGQSIWQKGSFAPFDRITMHQYSDHGRLEGYAGHVDLDIFYGNETDWMALASKEHTEPGTPPAPEPDWRQETIEYLEDEVLRLQKLIDNLRRGL